MIYPESYQEPLHKGLFAAKAKEIQHYSRFAGHALNVRCGTS